MITDPVIGSFVWVTSSLAFLAAATALVRLLDRRPAIPAADPAQRADEPVAVEPAETVAR